MGSWLYRRCGISLHGARQAGRGTLDRGLRVWAGIDSVRNREGTPQQDGWECIYSETKGFSLRVGEDRGLLEEGIIQAPKESAQEPVPNSMALPGLRIYAHRQPNSGGTRAGRVPVSVCGEGDAKPPCSWQTPSGTWAEQRHSKQEENLLGQVPLGVKYEEKYPLQERTKDLVWLVVWTSKGPVCRSPRYRHLDYTLTECRNGGVAQGRSSESQRHCRERAS